MRSLLDVNVLIALLDAGHAYHLPAMSWLEREIAHGWASCPLTQNGCIRIMSQPAYPGSIPASVVAERLSEAAAAPDHQFWPADISLLADGVLSWQQITGHKQVTDAYLLALAVRHGGRLASFDRRISWRTAPGAGSENLVFIDPGK